MKVPVTHRDPRQFIGHRIGDDTVVEARYRGEGRWVFTLLTPAGTRERYDLAL